MDDDDEKFVFSLELDDSPYKSSNNSVLLELKDSNEKLTISASDELFTSALISPAEEPIEPTGGENQE